LLGKLSDKFKAKMSKTGDKVKNKFKRQTDFATGLVSKSLRAKRKKESVMGRKKKLLKKISKKD